MATVPIRGWSPSTRPAAIDTGPEGLQYALSGDRAMLAYTRRDASGLPHLFIVQVDGLEGRQLTRGSGYADGDPTWTPGDVGSVTYTRRPVRRSGGHSHLGRKQL